MSEWFVYMIRASDNSLYTGVTTDVQRRFRQHGSARGARYFNGRSPVAVVYREQFPDRASAQRRESAIKKLGRAEKLELVATMAGREFQVGD